MSSSVLGCSLTFSTHSGWGRKKVSPPKNSLVQARAGKNSFPPTPFLFARPSVRILKFNVRIFIKKSSDFNQKASPIFRIRILDDYCLALALLGLDFNEDFERVFEI